eukprot:3404142-Rhodomonas_salina.1
MRVRKHRMTSAKLLSITVGKLRTWTACLAASIFVCIATRCCLPFTDPSPIPPSAPPFPSSADACPTSTPSLSPILTKVSPPPSALPPPPTLSTVPAPPSLAPLNGPTPSLLPSLSNTSASACTSRGSTASSTSPATLSLCSLPSFPSPSNGQSPCPSAASIATPPFSPAAPRTSSSAISWPTSSELIARA